MKRNICLLTTLSISALAMLPLTSCYDSNILVESKETKNATVSVSVSPTVGTGHTFEGEPTADTSKDYRCRFISTMYEVDEHIGLPVHKQLKKTDIEVVRDGQDIASRCSLNNNILIIPASELTNNITINLLGAEIADWISWDTIQEISKKDTESDDEIAKKYFEIGDYKQLTHDKKIVGNATLIGMEQMDYLHMEGSEEHWDPSPFTFRMFTPSDLYKHDWGPLYTRSLLDQKQKSLIGYWESNYCDLWKYGNQMGSEQEFGFSPLTVNCVKETTDINHSTFFILSLKDLTGLDAPSVSTLSGDGLIPENVSDQATFSYFRKNEYISLKSVVQRVACDQEIWLRDVCHYRDPSISTDQAVNFLIGGSNGNRYCWKMNATIEHYTCWAFCL